MIVAPASVSADVGQLGSLKARKGLGLGVIGGGIVLADDHDAFDLVPQPGRLGALVQPILDPGHGAVMPLCDEVVIAFLVRGGDDGRAKTDDVKADVQGIGAQLGLELVVVEGLSWVGGRGLGL